MASVELKKVSKHFNKGVKALIDIDIKIEDGEFLVMVGPSGCGKSTALRIIAGLEETTSGTVFIDSKDVTYVPPKDRDIAMVFQNYALYPHMKVFDNLGFGLKLRKYTKDEIMTRVEEAAQILDIKHLLDRKPKELSGGQRQRVALGRAIVRKPSVFLFDEPLSNLDAKLRVQMRSEIKKLHQKLGTTMVYVTHDQVEAMTMGDRIVVLKDGMIHQIDRPLRLYDDPADAFVGGFIGSPSMNFIKLNIKDSRIVYENNTVLDIPDDLFRRIKGSGINTFLLGIRPEHIHLERSDNSIPVNVKLDLVEPMGSEVYVYLLFGSERIILKTNKYMSDEIGSSMVVYIDLKRSLFFDFDSKRRILTD